jgi:hypothetical protein
MQIARVAVRVEPLVWPQSSVAIRTSTPIPLSGIRPEGLQDSFWAAVNVLSERCHPNALGHNFMFSKLDRSDASIAFCDEREPARNGQMFLAALAPLPLVESMMARLDGLIDRVAEFQHRVAPVGGSATPPV